MKTLIVGTGVIGVINGRALTEASVDVTHFVRKGKKDKFKDGVTLDLRGERVCFTPTTKPCNASPPTPQTVCSKPERITPTS